MNLALFSSSSVVHGQYLSDPDENVDGVHVNTDRIVDGIVGSAGIKRMVLGSMDDLLSVIKHESAEKNKATVEGERVDSGAQSRGGWQEVGGDGRGKDHPESHGQRPSHVQELVAGSASGHRAKAADHSCRVPGGAIKDGTAEEANGGDDGADHPAVGHPS